MGDGTVIFRCVCKWRIRPQSSAIFGKENGDEPMEIDQTSDKNKWRVQDLVRPRWLWHAIKNVCRNPRGQSKNQLWDPWTLTEILGLLVVCAFILGSLLRYFQARQSWPCRCGVWKGLLERILEDVETIRSELLTPKPDPGKKAQPKYIWTWFMYIYI